MRNCAGYISEAEFYRGYSLLQDYANLFELTGSGGFREDFDWWQYLFEEGGLVSARRLPLAELDGQQCQFSSFANQLAGRVESEDTSSPSLSLLHEEALEETRPVQLLSEWANVGTFA
jgi:hypothetical protein